MVESGDVITEAFNQCDVALSTPGVNRIRSQAAVGTVI